MEMGYFQPGIQVPKSKSIMSSAASRNREPIWNILKTHISKETRSILEVSSGSGMHVTYFAQKCKEVHPNLQWTPSEYDKRCFTSINNYIQSEDVAECVASPLHIDVLDPATWTQDLVDIILNINMIHITPFECSISLFQLAGKTLKSSGLLITYGPYSENGVLIPESNVIFNESLKSMNCLWGIRDLSNLIELATDNGITLKKTYNMPANNKILVWEKQ